MTSKNSGQFVEIGAQLRKARESRGEELSHAAARIALSPAQLRAVEAGDLQPFYNFPYYVQAAQRYAEFLGVTLPEISASRGVLIPSVPESIVKSDPSVRQAARSVSFSRNPIVVSEVPDEEPEAQIAEIESQATAPKPAAPIATPVATATFERPPTKVEKHQNPWAWASAATLAGVGVLGFSVMTAGMFPPELTPTTQTANNTTQATTSAAVQATPVSASPSSANAVITTAALSTGSATDAANAASAPVAQNATASAPVVAVSQPQKVSAAASDSKFSMQNQDSAVLAKATNWVQIIERNGTKTNIDIEPGQSVDFNAKETMVIVVRFADRAVMTVRGKPVDLLAYKPDPEKSRALIYLDQIR